MNENLENNSLSVANNTDNSSNVDIQALTIFRDDICYFLELQKSSNDFLNVQVFILNILLFILVLTVFFKELLKDG